MSVLSALQGAGSTILSNLFVTLPIPSGTSDLSEQTFIVTGSNKGLGLESSRHLSRLGAAKIIMAVRSESKGHEAKQDILQTTGRSDSSIEVWSLDMNSYESIRAFATRASTLDRLDGVLANAGIMTNNFTLSGGSEQTLNVNVIGTLFLYLLLAPQMRESGQRTGVTCRYVIPNSALHYMAPLAELQSTEEGLIDRLNDPEKANMGRRYMLSKLLVVYAVRELAERGAASKRGLIIVNTPNPSFCKSNLAQESAGSAAFKVGERLLARSTEEGSRALVHGLFAGEESNGQYLTNCHVER